MGREVWGTYSVRDHLEPQPFAADVMLYDRLVIPVPPGPDDPEAAAEWMRWKQWNPERQQELLAILGDTAYLVPWNSWRRQRWADLHGAALGQLSAQIDEEVRRPTASSPWAATAMVLGEGLPPQVTAVTAVATYRSAEQLTMALEMREVGPRTQLPQGQLVVVMGREFLLPDPADFPNDDDLLRAAVELCADPDTRRRRTSYWRWQREFLRDGMFVDPVSIQDALDEMGDLIADEQRAIRRSKFRFITLFAMCVASATLGLATGPLAPVAIASAFLSVGQFVGGEVLSERGSTSPSAASLLISGQKGLGWDA